MRRPPLLRDAFLPDRDGAMATVVALILPALLVLALGAAQLNQILSDRRRTQDVADSAALMGAESLTVTPSGAASRAQAFAQGQLAALQAGATVTVGATAGQNQTMTVAIDTQRPSFFGSLLPPGGFHTHVSSTAKAVNSAPLCVLTLAASPGDEMHMTDGQMQAGQCLVHSNSSVQVDGTATLLASATEAVDKAQGAISPAALTGAPPVKDPFADLSVDASCPAAKTPTSITTTQTLQPQTFAGPVQIGPGGHSPITVTLAPGVYYFCGQLTLSNAVAVTGADVALVFAHGAGLGFGGPVPSAMGVVANPTGPSLWLSGRQEGALAGFALIADRSYTGTFQLMSDYVTNLTGTVYVPTATLQVQGSALSGSASPWTVIDAEAISTTNSPQLVINADYSASAVPVPKGVGSNRPGGSQLTD